MFKNYFKTAYRSLARNKTYAIINIAGLAVGIAVCLLIFTIIRFHTGYDKFHAKEARIYRVLTEIHNTDAGNISTEKGLPLPLPGALKTGFPQAEQVAPVYASHNDQLQVLDINGAPVKNFKEQRGVFYTDPSFFRIFDFPLLAGTYTSLAHPNNVLLTKETAERYFGDWKTALGKSIRLTGSYTIGAGLFQFPAIVLKVTGVLASIPANTDFQLKLVIAYGTDFTGDTQYGLQNQHWGESSADLGCYVLLPIAASSQQVSRQLADFARKINTSPNKNTPVLQPLSAVHYDSQTGNYSNKTISHQLINVLWLIASFILLIACVNFINLATAQAINRAKEIGVRKVLGSNKSQLRLQFMIETCLIVMAAVVVALVVAVLAAPYINKLLDISLSFNIRNNPTIVLFLLALTVIVTTLAGLYPSFVLSRYNPVNALKSKPGAGKASGISLRRGLVVFQFIIAQALIFGTSIIIQQMNYFMNRPLGFDKEAVVNLPFRPDNSGSTLTAYLRQQLLSVNGVKAVSFSSSTPIEDDNNILSTFRYNHALKESAVKAITRFSDNEYVPTYKLPLVAGRNLQSSDMVKEFLVNETLVKSLGINRPQDILNKDLSMWDDRLKGPVVGVLRDFNDRSLRHAVAPLIMTTNITMYRQVDIKLSTANISTTLQAVKKIWEQTFPDYVYEYRFLDEKIDGFYKQEAQLSQLYKLFAAIAIFLSCLGLYGLAAYMAAQRIKEIGIRKVLGATSSSIVYLFSKEFILLIAIAFSIATPLAWLAMHRWLQDYVYRIDISWWLFGAGGLAAVTIALATISYQAIKAARANPVHSLRMD